MEAKYLLMKLPDIAQVLIKKTYRNVFDNHDFCIDFKAFT